MPDISQNTAIYCFAYGPNVSPTVRRRRRLKTCDEQPACLPDYRLSFAVGGFANLVRQRGYEVHGLLMRFRSQEDWNCCKDYDEGYNALETVEVYPYGSDESVCAYIMVMKDYSQLKPAHQNKQLPNERYLKLMASGLRANGIDEDYIEDQLLNIPYEPSCKPENYQRIPKASNKLRTITFRKYQRLCSRGRSTYFVLGQKVLRLGTHDPKHPAAIWIRERLNGNSDSAFRILQTFIEPSLPMCESPDDLTSQHYAWCENFLVEFMAKCGIKLTKVYQMIPENPILLSALRSSGLKRLFRCRLFKASPDFPEESIEFSDVRLERERSRYSSTGHTHRTRSSLFLSSDLLHTPTFHDNGDTEDISSTGSGYFSANAVYSV